MSGTLSYIGSKTIGGTIPGVMAAVSIGKEELEASIAALADFRPAAVDIGAQIATAEAILADLRRAVALGIQPPSIEGQVAAMKQGLSGLLERLAIIRAFYDLCAAAGVDAYWYDGSAAGLGSALAAATAGGLPGGGGPLSHCDAIVLATAESATGAAMSEVFGSP